MGIDVETLRQLRFLLESLNARVLNLIGRGSVQLVDDSKGMQRVQVLGNLNEVTDGAGGAGAEHFQPYGFFSVPLPGARSVQLFLNGDRGHPIVIVIADPRHRAVDGEPGEAGLRTDEGDEIRLARSHTIQISTTGTLELGAAGASHGVIKGDARNTAEQTFLTALGVFVSAVGGLPGMSGPAATFNTAIGNFATAAAAAVSSKIKIDQ